MVRTKSSWYESIVYYSGIVKSTWWWISSVLMLLRIRTEDCLYKALSRISTYWTKWLHSIHEIANAYWLRKSPRKTTPVSLISLLHKWSDWSFSLQRRVVSKNCNPLFPIRLSSKYRFLIVDIFNPQRRETLFSVNLCLNWMSHHYWILHMRNVSIRCSNITSWINAKQLSKSQLFLYIEWR